MPPVVQLHLGELSFPVAQGGVGGQKFGFSNLLVNSGQ